MKKMSWMPIVALAVAVPAGAQVVSVVEPQKVEEKRVQEMVQKRMLEQNLGVMEQKIAERASVLARVTKGAPYSAQTTTESVQVLADGNRIVRRTTSLVYRDSEGRTRTERTANGSTTITISDPVTGTTYMLNPDARTAQRSGTIVWTQGGELGSPITYVMSGVTTETRTADGSVKIQVRDRAAGVDGGAPGGAASGFVVTYEPEKKAVVEAREPGGAAKEDLGQQVMEGVTVTGSRTTTVIEAGAIGNEQPIRIVSEEWFSPDLKVLVQTKFSDPRSGETTFHLSGIVRSEPDPSLFTVPADYTMKESIIRRDSMR